MTFKKRRELRQRGDNNGNDGHDDQDDNNEDSDEDANDNADKDDNDDRHGKDDDNDNDAMQRRSFLHRSWQVRFRKQFWSVTEIEPLDPVTWSSYLVLLLDPVTMKQTNEPNDVCNLDTCDLIHSASVPGYGQGHASIYA